MVEPADVFAAYRGPLEEALRRAVPADPSSPVTGAVRYVLGWEDAEGRPANAPGKRLRPLFTLHVAAIRGKSFELALPGAVAVELVHNFSLVHDEIQDHDAERHGRPTLWKRLGTAQAINAGDYLFTLAFAALGNLPGEAVTGRAITLLTEATGSMIRGQWSDLSFEDRDAVTTGEYLEMVAGKTGALIGAAGALGALCTGGSDEEVAAFRRWGTALGLAFQARDDYLGIWGDVALTGKSNTNDLARRKKSLPVLLGLGDPRCRDALQQLYAAPPDEAVHLDEAVAALEAADVPAETEAFVARYRAEAEDALSAIGLDADQEAELRVMARLLVDRDR